MIVRCATTNRGKLREFRRAGEQTGDFEVEPLPGLRDLAPPDETGKTFEANAIEKVLYYAAHTEDWIFVDDSGLEVNSLAGAPGVYSARFAGEGSDDAANNRLLLDRLGGSPDRSARFVCVIALAHEGRLVRTFRGEVNGTIVEAPRGPHGFGYDPLFYYAPFGCTFGEADPDEKMKVSHRAQALRAMFSYLASRGSE